MTGPLAPAWTSYILQLKQPVLAVGAGFVEGSAAVRQAEQGVHAGVPGVGDFFHCSRTGRRAWSVGVFVFPGDIPVTLFPDAPLASGRNLIDLAENEGLFIIGGGDSDGPDILMKFEQNIVDIRWEARGSSRGIDVVAVGFGPPTP
jgi:hypothetical protein